MGSKNKTVSFRVDEANFDALREIAEERDISLSAVFRDYVDELVAHDGQVRVVPESEVGSGDEVTFPARVEVPRSFIREHERLELEAEHLREQLEEHREYVAHLQNRLEELEADDVEEIVQLEDLDAAAGRDDVGETGDDRDEYASIRERLREPERPGEESFRLG